MFFMGYRNLVLIVLIALFVRIVNLDVIPIWQWDEGANLNIAGNLFEGRAQIFALKHSFIPHPPLYFLLSIPFIKAFGYCIFSLRILSVLASSGTAAIIYFTGRDFFNEKTGFLAGLIYALYPAAVFFGRIGFANNLLVFLSTLSFYSILAFLKTKKRTWLYIASLSAGASFITGFIGVACIIALLTTLYLTEKKSVKTALFTTLLLPGLFFSAAILLMPNEFLGDLHYHLERTILGSTFDRLILTVLLFLMIGGLAHAIRSFFRFIPQLNRKLLYVIYVFYSILCLNWVSQDFAIIRLHGVDYLTALSTLGLIVYPEYLVREDKKRRVLLTYLAVHVITLLSFNRTDHMTMILYPYVALGLAALMQEMKKLFNKKSSTIALAASLLIIVHPLLICAIQDYNLMTGETYTPQDVENTILVADYVNERASVGDVVLTYSWMAHLLSSESGIILQAFSYDGFDVDPYYLGSYPSKRWVFNTSSANARFIVLTDEDLGALRDRYAGQYEFLIDELSVRDKVFIGGFGVYGERM